MTEAQSTTFSVHQLAGFPATRSLGREGRDRLDDLLIRHDRLDLTIDFGGVQAMTMSFVDEFLGKFLTANDFSQRSATLKVTGLDEDNRYAVVVCVERRDTQVAILEKGALGLIGDPMLAATFAAASGLGAFSANQLADALGLSAPNANNRLKRLTAVGALRKAQVTGSSRGGREYLYHVVSAQVVDGPPLTPA